MYNRWVVCENLDGTGPSRLTSGARGPRTPLTCANDLSTPVDTSTLLRTIFVEARKMVRPVTGERRRTSAEDEELWLRRNPVHAIPIPAARQILQVRERLPAHGHALRCVRIGRG